MTKNFQISPRGAKKKIAKGKGCVPGTCFDKNVNLCAAFFILPLRRFWGIEFHFRAVWVEVKRDRLKTTAWEARLFWT